MQRFLHLRCSCYKIGLKFTVFITKRTKQTNYLQQTDSFPQFFIILLAAYDSVELCTDGYHNISSAETERAFTSPQYPQNYSISKLCNTSFTVSVEGPIALVVKQNVQICEVPYTVMPRQKDLNHEVNTKCTGESRELIYTQTILLPQHNGTTDFLIKMLSNGRTTKAFSFNVTGITVIVNF